MTYTMHLITSGTSANNGIALPSLIITSLKVELSDEFKTSSGKSFICSLFKNLDFNLLQIEHRTLICSMFNFVVQSICCKFIYNDWTCRLSKIFTFNAI